MAMCFSHNFILKSIQAEVRTVHNTQSTTATKSWRNIFCEGYISFDEMMMQIICLAKAWYQFSYVAMAMASLGSCTHIQQMCLAVASKLLSIFIFLENSLE